MADQPLAPERPVAPQRPFTTEQRRRIPSLRLVLWAIVVALLVWFVIQNSKEVEVKLTFWKTDVRLAVALLISAALGFLMGLLLPRLRR